MASKSHAAELFTKLSGATEVAVATLENRDRMSVDLESQFTDIERKFEDAAQLKDTNQRELRLKILETELSELCNDAAREEQDLAQAVFGLNAMLESMGSEYQDLMELDDREKSIIEQATAKLESAKVDRAQANQKWFFKDSAVKQSEQELQEATLALDAAQAEARQMARQRLMSANMESSLQEFMLRVDKTVQIMQRRMTLINEQLTTVAARKVKAFEIKELAAKALQELDQKLNALEADLLREEDLLKSIESSSPEHSAQTSKLSNLRADVERFRGERNTAFVLHQSKDKFATELGIHEKTQMKLRDNQRMWITSLKSDTEERIVTFRSRLEAMKAAADQDIAKSLDDLGAEVDQRNAEYMARVGMASDKRRMEKMEKHPTRMAKMAEVAAAQAEAIQQIRIREANAIEQFKKLYGIDPTASSFFHYETEDSGADPTKTKSPGVF